MLISLPTRVEVSPEVLFQELPGEAVLLNLTSERYYGLDDVGMRMWALLSQDGDVAAACAQLLEEYDVGEDQLQADLAALIGRLAEAGLLTVTFPAENDASAAAPSAADVPPGS